MNKEQLSFIANVEHIIFEPEQPSVLFKYREPELIKKGFLFNRRTETIPGCYTKYGDRISNIFEYLKDKEDNNRYKIINSDRSGGPYGTVYQNAAVEIRMFGGKYIETKTIFFDSNEEAQNFIKESTTKYPQLIVLC